MSDALIIGLISGAVSLLGIVVSLVGIFVSAKSTRDGVIQQLNTNQQLTNNEISHIKAEITDMKKDIKSHNQYAKLFNENIPVIKEKLSIANKRIAGIEEDIKYYHRPERHHED
jgi:peptidoglycan hydrolase CwlO-like protein